MVSGSPTSARCIPPACLSKCSKPIAKTSKANTGSRTIPVPTASTSSRTVTYRSASRSSGAITKRFPPPPPLLLLLVQPPRNRRLRQPDPRRLRPQVPSLTSNKFAIADLQAGADVTPRLSASVRRAVWPASFYVLRLWIQSSQQAGQVSQCLQQKLRLRRSQALLRRERPQNR